MRFDRIDYLDRLPKRTKHHTLKALDIITRPLSEQELDEALQPFLLKSQRMATVRALRSIDIIAIVHGPDRA